MEMKKSKLEEVKSLVQKKVQALEGLEALIDGVDKSDLNRFLGKVSFGISKCSMKVAHNQFAIRMCPAEAN